MRALLIVNPTATATTARSRDVVASALSSELKLDIVATDHRGHAAELAHQARADGLDLVVALGGDGTVNEAVNGLLADGEGDGVPAFAAIPGGSTNVFARNLGFTNDLVEATGELLEAIHANRFRAIGLGTVKADQLEPRWFTFTAGVGLDAAVVRRVERVRHQGTRATGNLYARSAILELLASNRREPALTMQVEGEAAISGVFFSLVSNSTPWSYLGSRGITMSPKAHFDTGLDVFAMTRMPVPAVIKKAVQGWLSKTGPKGRHLESRHDIPGVTFTAARPMPFQGDGDDFGDATQLQFRSVPAALRVPACAPR